MHRVTKNCLAIQFYFIKETLKSELKDHLFFIYFFFYKDMQWRRDTEPTLSHFRICFMSESHPVGSRGKPNPKVFSLGLFGT